MKYGARVLDPDVLLVGLLKCLSSYDLASSTFIYICRLSQICRSGGDQVYRLWVTFERSYFPVD